MPTCRVSMMSYPQQNVWINHSSHLNSCSRFSFFLLSHCIFVQATRHQQPFWFLYAKSRYLSQTLYGFNHVTHLFQATVNWSVETDPSFSGVPYNYPIEFATWTTILHSSKISVSAQGVAYHCHSKMLWDSAKVFIFFISSSVVYLFSITPWFVEICYYLFLIRGISTSTALKYVRITSSQISVTKSCLYLFTIFLLTGFEF